MMLAIAVAPECVVLPLNDSGGSFHATRTSPPFLAGSSYGPCGIPQPEPPTFPTFSAPGRLVALTPQPGAPLAAVPPDDSALAAVVLAPCWPGVPLHADITSSAVAD